MTCRHTQRTNTRCTLYRDPQAVLFASTSARRLRLSGRCHGTTRGETGSGCIVLVRTSHRLSPEHHHWECGFPFTTRNGMEMSQLAMAVRRVVRQMERAQVQMTKKVVRSHLKGTRCRGRSGTTRCGITTTESIMCLRLKGLSRYMVRHSSSL